MKPVSVPLLLGLGVGAAALGAVVSMVLLRTGGSPLIITPFLSAFFVLLGVWLLVAGRAVRHLKAKEDTWISPVGAARTAILARASAQVTAAFAGALFGVSSVGFTRLWASATAMSAWTALAGGLAATFCAIVAVVVERWCVDEGDSEGGAENKRRDPGGQQVSSPPA